MLITRTVGATSLSITLSDGDVCLAICALPLGEEQLPEQSGDVAVSTAVKRSASGLVIQPILASDFNWASDKGALAPC